ncbi:VPS9 domain-containing protein 1-like isoform X3 [Pezoporus wallicus]|uniref:VPS9 domain-containing protein 1-like isoform X3 n=1 Tax=Pezoporus wallicus TaxID=35540 RepID=UPI00254B9120|nr:VPS9 domain-containing protein 1-like isoform X3 [Pezoporus wallicus]
MLSLQLQMVENLVIAKAQEETLQWKMEEQRLQLQEAANRYRGCHSRDPGGHPGSALTWGHSTPRRFSSSMDLTPEEQEQSSLYTTILKYEQDHVRLAEAVESQAEAEPSGSLPVVRALLLPPQAVVPDAAGLQKAEHSHQQGPVPGLPGGGLFPNTVGPAAGSVGTEALGPGQAPATPSLAAPRLCLQECAPAP